MILCCGESLIDMLPRTSTEGEAAFAPHAGGAVFNTAIALGRLGGDAAFFSGISTDLFGEILTDALAASGVDATPAARSDRPTTLAFVKLVEGQASYAFYDEGTAGRMLTEADLPDTRADALFFGGISLVVEPCGAAYEALATRAAPDAAIMIDPNIRPGFIAGEAAYRDRLARMIALADIVKLSDDDLRWLEGDGDLGDLARALLARGPRLVCITEGPRGATGYTADHEVFLAAPDVTVADTVGAGDTFNAGLLAALAEAGRLSKDGLADLPCETVEAALSLGARAAAVTVSRAGANPPHRPEL